jgi:hypothetical protein
VEIREMIGQTVENEMRRLNLATSAAVDEAKNGFEKKKGKLVWDMVASIKVTPFTRSLL